MRFFGSVRIVDQRILVPDPRALARTPASATNFRFSRFQQIFRSKVGKISDRYRGNPCHAHRHHTQPNADPFAARSANDPVQTGKSTTTDDRMCRGITAGIPCCRMLAPTLVREQRRRCLLRFPQCWLHARPKTVTGELGFQDLRVNFIDFAI